MTTFLQEVVNAALARCPDTESGVARLAEASRIAVGLVEDDDGWSTAAGTHRMRRVTFLPDILRPDAAVEAYARTGSRAYAHALEKLCSSDSRC